MLSISSIGTKIASRLKIKAINDMLPSWPRISINVTLVDTWTIFANDAGDAKPEEFPDLLHPNEAGYSKWRAALNPCIPEVGGGKTVLNRVVRLHRGLAPRCECEYSHP